MSDGPKSPENSSRITRRTLLRRGAVAGAGFVSGILLSPFIPKRLTDSMRSDVSGEEKSAEKNVAHQRLETLSKKLLNEVNPSTNQPFFDSLNKLKEMDETTLNKYIAHNSLPAGDEGNVMTGIYLSIDGKQRSEEGRIELDAVFGTLKNSEGKLIKEEITFYINEEGRIISSPDSSAQPIEQQKLKDAARIVLKNPIHDLQWQTHSVDEEYWKDGTIAYTLNEDRFTKTISIGADGMVSIITDYKD